MVINVKLDVLMVIILMGLDVFLVLLLVLLVKEHRHTVQNVLPECMLIEVNVQLLAQQP